MSDTIKWAELPVTAKGSKYDPIMEALKTRPGEYAVVSDGDSKNPYSLAAYLRGKFPEHTFVTRNGVIYARWDKKGKAPVIKLKKKTKRRKKAEPAVAA